MIHAFDHIVNLYHKAGKQAVDDTLDLYTPAAIDNLAAELGCETSLPAIVAAIINEHDRRPCATCKTKDYLVSTLSPSFCIECVRQMLQSSA